MGHEITKEPYSYIIYKSDSIYYAEDANGSLVYGGPNDKGGVEGIDLAGIINASDNILTSDGGLIFLNLYGSHNIDTKLDLGRKTKLRGLGPLATTLAASADLTYLIEIDDSNAEIAWEIRDLGLDMNGQNGNGIYCGHAQYGAGLDYVFNSMHNIMIEDIKANYAGIYIKDPMTIYASHIHIRTKGYGIRLGHSNLYDVSCGNSQWNMIDITLRDNNAIGLEVLKGTTYNAGNLSIWNRLGVYASNRSDCIGVKVVGVPRITFNLPNIEFLTTATNCTFMYLEDTTQIEVFNPYFFTNGSNVSTIGVHLTGTSSTRNKFIGGRITVADGTSVLDDSSTQSTGDTNVFGPNTRIYKIPDFGTNSKTISCPVWTGAAFAIQDSFS